MRKRTLRLGDYDTAVNGWTLAAWDLEEPSPVLKMQDVPGRVKGPLNMSNILTDGQPVYSSRAFSATLESSEGDRLAREARISDMVNQLHGREVSIRVPDHPDHYAVGVLTVKRKYNDPAHGSVEVSGTCEPWLYAREETVVLLQATEAEQTVRVRNAGVMPVIPTLQVSGGTVNLAHGSDSFSMEAGSYLWPDLYLTTGDHVVTYTGTGLLTITYREAVLR